MGQDHHAAVDFDSTATLSATLAAWLEDKQEGYPAHIGETSRTCRVLVDYQIDAINPFSCDSRMYWHH